MVGAAIGATGDYLERAAELVQGGRRRAGHRHRARPLGGDGPRHARVPQALRRRPDDRRQRRDRRGHALPDRARRRRRQGRHRPRRRLHDAHDHQLRRAAGAGAGRVPARGRGLRRADHRRRRDQAARRARRSAAVRRRLRDARQRVRRHRGGARRSRAQGGGAARVAEDGQGPVQGAARHGVDRGDPRSPRRRGSRHARARGASAPKAWRSACRRAARRGPSSAT